MDIIINSDPLVREVYTFWFANEYHLWLDVYRYEIRETTRHKFKTIKIWSRLGVRDSNIKLGDFKFDDDIKNIAKDQLLKQIKVGLWEDGR
jgi:hypothetical protein